VAWKRRTDFRVFKKGGGVILAPACHAERPLSSSFTCDTLDRASPDPERLGHPQDANTLRKLLSHLTFSRAVYLWPTELHALGDGALEACFDSLANHNSAQTQQRRLLLGKRACPLVSLCRWPADQ
jgi:hypothetical protein